MLANRVLLKQNDTFVVGDDRGDFPADDEQGFGLYRQDCRFLSTYELRVNGEQPILLSHSVDRAYVATFQLVNPEMKGTDGTPIDQQTLSIRRTRFVHEGLHDRIGLHNCTSRPMELELELRFDADFLDIFAVRGYGEAQQRGVIAPPRDERGTLVLGYQGRDGLPRQTRILIDPEPRVRGARAMIPVHLEPQGVFVAVVGILPLLDEEPEQIPEFDLALDDLERMYEAWNVTCTRVATDNAAFDGGILWRNLEDLRVLSDDRPTGLLPTAGIPWYAVPFGRDALITSLQTLSLNPDLARGSLRFLAQHQGTTVDPFREEEPGKIMHEIRFGELARLRKIPHTPYYGSVDATPLFLVLLIELLRWTADLSLLDELWPNVEAALSWIDEYGDVDGDGFVEFAKRSKAGVRNQGWKDSANSLMSPDGEPAALPAALVEVQGYVYHAKAGLAGLCRRTGRRELASRLEREAAALRGAFERRFWMPRERYYAQALDGRKAQIPSITSSPGHCLWSGIVEPAHAGDVAAQLGAAEMFSGWGVRTLSAESPFYNPMSYHNGSVWPHDNSLIAHGLRRYGFAREAELLARSVLEGCMRFADNRIPELFCGFARDQRFHSGPGEYLISCSPQAWGAGSLFHFLQTLLGVEADVLDGTLRIAPLATPLFSRLHVEGMRVGDGECDFTVHYGAGSPRVVVDRKPAAIRVLELAR